MINPIMVDGEREGERDQEGRDKELFEIFKEKYPEPVQL